MRVRNSCFTKKIRLSGVEDGFDRDLWREFATVLAVDDGE